jgi:pilus assembly protein CpaB
MNVSRIAILGVALVAGAAAFVLMMGNSGDQGPIQIVEPVKEESVRVLIASRDIQRGERLSVDDTSWIAWPKNAVQPTFITDATPEKREALESAVARSLIVTGEPVVDAKIVQAGSSGLMAAIIAPGFRAVTMRVSPETSSGGFILPGDRVDILHTSGRDDDARTRILFEDVRVLAVNAIYSEATGTPNIDGSNITLEFSPSDAEAFIATRNAGSMSLVLRSIFKPEGELQADKRSSDVSIIRYGRS